MEKEQFLDDLDADFVKYQPYYTSTTIEARQMVSLSSWHETTKDLERSKPLLPLSRLGTPAVVTARPQTTARRSDNGSPGRATAEYHDSGRMRNTGEKHGKKFLKTDMTSLCSQGWNLSHGWHNRPKAVQIKDEVVDANIQKWASRIKQAQRPRGGRGRADIAVIHTSDRDREGGRDRDREEGEAEEEDRYMMTGGGLISSRGGVGGGTGRTDDDEYYDEFDAAQGNTNEGRGGGGEGEEDDDYNHLVYGRQEPENRFEITKSPSAMLILKMKPRPLGRQYATPGPKYNLRPAAGRLTKKEVFASRSDDSTVRDIRFSSPSSALDRFSYGKADVVPLSDSARPLSPSYFKFMKVFESGRNEVGSIYEAAGRVVGPGTGKYNTIKPYEKSTHIVTVNGTNFAPIRSTPKKMLEKHISEAIPRHPPPKPLW